MKAITSMSFIPALGAQDATPNTAIETVSIDDDTDLDPEVKKDVKTSVQQMQI